METTKIKRFATTARIKLTQGVLLKLQQTGFDTRGNITDEPVLLQGGTMFRGRPISDESFYYRWQSLKGDIERYGVREVCERVAYTWFNRLAAIRILAKNGLIDPVIEYADHEMRIPQIVADARRGMNIPPMSDYDKLRWSHVAGNAAERDAQFLLLITAYCHSNPIIYRCFGGMQDYSELLLPDNILAKGEFVDMLNDAEAISDDDYRSPELIGWLYQFYISDRKSEVLAAFKKGVKAEASDIPAATQIFTPNWIVKYMVQNTVGRIYLDNHPEATEHFKPRWKYLVEPVQPTPDEAMYKFKELPELSMADLACGSGHILTECFDLLFDLYDYEDYSTREAVENIFTHNLTGIDIDTRAKQLATFALMLKACQRDRSFADAHVMPRVLDMPNVDCYTWKDLGGHMMCALKAQLPSDKVNQELVEAFKLMEQAHNLGSIMKFDVSPETRDFIKECLHQQSIQHQIEDKFADLFHGFEIILTLTEKYSALVMNPPYMGASNMNTQLSDYVKKNYPDGKADLMTVFMIQAKDLLLSNGYWGMINLPSWMFLASFEDLRLQIVQNQQIIGLLQNGRGVFGADFGSVTFVVQNSKPYMKGEYRRLFERHVQVRNVETIHQLFLNKSYGLYWADQKAFLNINGCPIGYWLSEQALAAFSGKTMGNISQSAEGIKTGNNERFIRFWFEVASDDISICEPSYINKKWDLIHKGGERHKWYGNINNVVLWENDGQVIRSMPNSGIQGSFTFDKEGFTWSDITSGGMSFRLKPLNHKIDSKGPTGICIDHNDLFYVLALLNSKVIQYFSNVLNPTISFKVGNMRSLPFIKCNEIFDQVESKSRQNVAISREDWDAHETSWDFKTNELISLLKRGLGTITTSWGGSNPSSSAYLNLLYEEYKAKWNEKFSLIHTNEEELNRQFIDIYGLQDELTPDVPMNEVTILQQGEISIENNEIVWHDDVIMKQFISYAVGCMMGRYSIDKPGLILANQGDGLKEYEALVPNSRFEVDDDGIIPLLPADCGFPDNARARIIDFLKTVFGNETLSQNLNFVEQCLGKTLEQYLIKDFWKDHKSRYQNRPIYWLFRSKRGAFQCVVYMHRMTQWTADQVRHKYLLPYIDNLRNRLQQALDARKQSTADKLRKAIDECEEYQERLKVVADRQIAFDLDDGVAKNYDLFGDVLAKI